MNFRLELICVTEDGTEERRDVLTFAKEQLAMETRKMEFHRWAWWKGRLDRSWQGFRIKAELISRSIVIVSLPIIIIGGIVSCLQRNDSLNQPDIHLEFIQSESTAVNIVNVGDKVANNILYGFGLLNLEKGKQHVLPMIIKRVKYVLPRSQVGPTMVLGSMVQRNLVKTGDRIFGSATVSCLECKERRSYWLYSKHGFGGWYVEIQKEDPPPIFTNKMFNDPENELIKLFPEEKRIPIK